MDLHEEPGPSRAQAGRRGAARRRWPRGGSDLDNCLTFFHGVILLRTMKTAFYGHCLFVATACASRFFTVPARCIFHGHFTLYHCHSWRPCRLSDPRKIAKWFSREHGCRCDAFSDVGAHGRPEASQVPARLTLHGFVTGFYRRLGPDGESLFMKIVT